MRMCDDRKFAFMRFINYRKHFVHRHLILIDELDNVDARLR